MNLSELAGGCIVTGFRGATLDDPQCRADIQLLKDLNIKGVILFDTHLPTGGLRNIVNEDQLRQLTDDLRNELGSDLIIGIDQEGGSVNRLGLFQDAGVSEQLSARMQGAMSPKQLGSTIDPVAKALTDAGINLTFAPCIDLEINPANPIIAGKDRSLGRDPNRVAQSASTIIKTYDNHDVRCCLKHYPGHGSSTADTHLGLADITDTYHEDEHHVYKLLIDSVLTGSLPNLAVMTGHLINHLADPLLPASLSHMHSTQALRNQLGFEGLIITDSIDMDAVLNQHDPGAASLLAVQAGADIVLNGFNAVDDIDQDHPAKLMHDSLVRAIENGTISRQRVAQSHARRHALIP
jgi:beta-N-acetylhexosaminidase